MSAALREPALGHFASLEKHIAAKHLSQILPFQQLLCLQPGLSADGIRVLCRASPKAVFKVSLWKKKADSTEMGLMLMLDMHIYRETQRLEEALRNIGMTVWGAQLSCT